MTGCVYQSWKSDERSSTLWDNWSDMPPFADWPTEKHYNLVISWVSGSPSLYTMYKLHRHSVLQSSNPFRNTSAVNEGQFRRFGPKIGCQLAIATSLEWSGKGRSDDPSASIDLPLLWIRRRSICLVMVDPEITGLQGGLGGPWKRYLERKRIQLNSSRTVVHVAGRSGGLN